MKEKRIKEGMTLDNMFEVENNFLIVLHLVLSWNNEESLKLAEAILNKKSQKEHRVFKRLIGDAFRIAGNQKTSKYLDFIEWYVGAVGNIEADGEDTFIDDNIL